MFTGFTQETVDFMWGIRFNNDKSWFEPRKEIYRTQLYEPMKALGAELYDFLAEKRPKDELLCRVTRIYRDARRLHGKGPYKDHLWLCIEEPAEDFTARPTFWFELGPAAWSCGMGYWMARPMEMAKLRARIHRDPETMASLTRRLNDSEEFTLEGERYKKPRAAAPSPLLAPWYQMKTVAITHEEQLTEEIFDLTLAAHIKADYEFLLPYYDYFRTLRSDPAPEKP